MNRLLPRFINKKRTTKEKHDVELHEAVTVVNNQPTPVVGTFNPKIHPGDEPSTVTDPRLIYDGWAKIQIKRHGPLIEADKQKP